MKSISGHGTVQVLVSEQLVTKPHLVETPKRERWSRSSESLRDGLELSSYLERNFTNLFGVC